MSLIESVINTLDVELVLSGVLVDLLGHVFSGCLFVSVVQKLDLLQNLKSGDSDVLELVNSDDIVRCFIVKRDLSILSVGIAHVLVAVHVNSGLSVLELFLVDDHWFG